MSGSRACPCGSGSTYATCCAPLHRGEREAADPTALMRSRFAAFATKQVDYVFRTLHADHEDRARPREGVMRAIRDACAENRYLGLRILDARGPNADGVAQVLFAARVFHRGKERSFVECSDFVHDGVGWRYRSGEGIARAWDEVRPTTIAEFLARRPDVTA